VKLMRVIEVIVAIAILVGGVASLTAYTNTPAPQTIYSTQLTQLGYSALQQAEATGVLQQAAFNPNNPRYVDQMESALSAVLPSNVVYNLSFYNISQQQSQGVTTTGYIPLGSISDYSGHSPTFSVTLSYVVAPLNLSFRLTPHPYPTTLFILNNSDALGWWITGYTSYALATSLKQLFTVRHYFENVVTINSSQQMYTLLSAGSLTPKPGETYNLQNSILINVFGEAVPIPTNLLTTKYNTGNFGAYDKWLGQQIDTYNVTWVSVVGWPFYEVTNTNQTGETVFESVGCQPYYGIVGICSKNLQGAGLQNFLEGLTGQTCSPPNPSNKYTSLSPEADYAENYYGVYVNQFQTASRAMPISAMQACGVTAVLPIVLPQGGYAPAEVYVHYLPGSPTKWSGSFVDIGLVRIPDIRVTGLALFTFFHPQVIPATNYTASDYTRLVILQLGEV